ncbi:unnamed protein product, partial [Mesorhabditis belari]|uniref:Battenin n=1 Tax=Mesorhabditis belari TaxID=2138241 RepID=A0AAF3EMD6_9BILA
MTASISNGIGGTTILSYSSHFPDSTPVAVSSGMGAAGIVGSFLYASLTEPHLANLSPGTAILLMLVFPFTLATFYWLVLDHPSNLMKKCLKDPTEDCQEYTARQAIKSTSLIEKIGAIKPSLRFLLPMIVVYMAEYTTNQGFIQFIVFDCANGFGLAKISQYRWFQFIYRVGTFVTKTSLLFIDFSTNWLYLFPLLQLSNGVLFYFEALFAFLPHISLPFLMVFISGLVGGACLSKTYNHIHKTTPADFKPFLLGVASTSDTFGIFLAAFLSIWVWC